MTNKAKRLYFYTTATLLSAFAVALVLIALDENIIYFYSPSEVNQSEAATLLRVGGLVKDGSLKIDNDLGIKFIIEPYIRFKGLPGEQMTMFFYDPSGNALEFKSFKNISQLFEK